MSAACLCPDIPAPDQIGAGPITCTCCGQPLVITCPGECGTEHVRQSVARAIGRPVTAERTKRKSPVYTRPRVYKPKVCGCGETFIPTGPRGEKCPKCRKERA